MKKTLISITLIVATSIVIIPSCKKKSTDPVAATPTPVVPATNYLCDGNGTTSYIPLVIGNTWNYVLVPSMYSTENHVSKITKTQVLSNSKTYFVLDYDNGAKQDYFRTEANGDIYCWGTNSFNDLAAGENFFLPANPTVGQSWKNQYFIPDSFAVMSINASLTSANGCTYSGVLKINTYSSGAYYDSRYYKKGIGMVQQTSMGFFAYTERLTSVTLN